MGSKDVITFGILTVCDPLSADESQKSTGAELKQIIQTAEGFMYGSVTWTYEVPDDIPTIQDCIKRCCDEVQVDVLCIAGGTGLAPKDIIPDALRGCIEKEIAGMNFTMFLEEICKGINSYASRAILSRAVVGVRGKTLIASFPRTHGCSVGCLKSIVAAVPYVVDMEVDDTVVNRTQNKSKVVIGTDETNRVKASPYPVIQNTELPVLFKYLVSPLGVRLIRTEDALGYVLAEDVVSAENIPQFRTSMKDGYAIGEVDDRSSHFQVIGEYFPGTESNTPYLSLELPLRAEEAVKVRAGNPVPPGTFCVVPVEATALVPGHPDVIELSQSIYENSIQEIGSDVCIGDIVLRRGTLITVSNLSTLAAIGKSEIPVFCKPVVAVLSCGDELQEMWGPLHPRRVRDSNKIALKSLLKSWGFGVVDLGIVADEPNAVLKSLKDGFVGADVVITTGGMSTGHRDIVKSVLVEDLGAKIHFGRLDVKALELTGFGTFYDWQGQRMKHWFGIPGNPASAFIAAHMVVLPVLKMLSGRTTDIFHQRIVAIVGHDLNCTDYERLEYQRGYLNYKTAEGILTDVPFVFTTGVSKQRSSNITGCSGATCLVEIPPGQNYVEGDRIFITLLE